MSILRTECKKSPRVGGGGNSGQRGGCQVPSPDLPIIRAAFIRVRIGESPGG
ncbi:hypothetical protein BOO71_0009259 [Deinococcus marmoris]|uniref:Uncharacterized protein n=1 Tax=Deinococcus marmoris TaxID=249408 RepID=A0A1U7NWM2_9DEIO|nr:hypothetical protein BOO71_0009259 [Deinococcus marmoris]